MIELVYVSSAVRPFTPEQLAALLEKSRENNARAGLTGMLLYKGGNFMQALEGEEEAVKSLHAKIAADPRHRGMITLMTRPIAERSFADWSMAFRDLASPADKDIPGYSEFLNTPLTGEEFADPGRCQKILLTFKRAM
jgi:Sensors of blue-light using FAD